MLQFWPSFKCYKSITLQQISNVLLLIQFQAFIKNVKIHTPNSDLASVSILIGQVLSMRSMAFLLT